jgi:hypothetical protein
VFWRLHGYSSFVQRTFACPVYKEQKVKFQEFKFPLFIYKKSGFLMPDIGILFLISLSVFLRYSKSGHLIFNGPTKHGKGDWIVGAVYRHILYCFI